MMGFVMRGSKMLNDDWKIRFGLEKIIDIVKEDLK